MLSNEDLSEMIADPACDEAFLRSKLIPRGEGRWELLDACDTLRQANLSKWAAVAEERIEHVLMHPIPDPRFSSPTKAD